MEQSIILAPTLRYPGVSWPRWARVALLAALFTLPGLASLSFYYLSQTVAGSPPAWTYALVGSLSWWYIWALMTPAIVRLARRFPLDREEFWANLLGVHLPVMLALLLAHALVSLLLFRGFQLHDTLSMGLLEVHFTSRVHANAVAYFTILGFTFAYDYYRKYTLRERQAAALELQLAQANLRALRMQLNPHFLFNTLNSVAALVRMNDNATAVKMLGRLGEFLRLTLENKGLQEIPLAQELDFLERYLEIEQIRFQDRLTTRIDVQPEAKDLFVPNFILQPLVENAIHHGIAPHAGAGRIDIAARVEGGELLLEVRDDGPGMTTPRGARRGVGLANTAERLEQLYGKRQAFDYYNADTGGFVVDIRLPARTEPIVPGLQARLPETP